MKLKEYRGHIRNWKALCEELKVDSNLDRKEREEAIVLKAFERFGDDVGLHLIGMFAFAIEDEETGEPIDVDADDEEYGLVIMKTIMENGEEILSTPDSDEELEEVYNLFMERFFEEEDED